MKRTFPPFYSLAIAAFLAVSLFACKKENTSGQNSVQEAPDLEFYALTDDNKLLRLNANSSNSPISSVNITGLLSGEKALSIDFRPSTGQLYLLSSTSVLYTLDQNTGKASIVSKTPFDPKSDGMYATIDFNPTVDRVRFISDMGQNLRLHPETGVAVAIDGAINGVSGAMISGAAYTNSKAGATETTLYDIDATTDMLYKQLPPNDGTLAEVGSLGIDVTGIGGFDIAAAGNQAIAALNVGDMNKLYGIDLSSGMAMEYGMLPARIIGLAIPTAMVAYSIDVNNNLLIIHPDDAEPLTSKSISGLATDEKIIGLDMRPATGQLYALGNMGNLYTINMASGAAAGIGSSAIALRGSSFGFDFNPTVDRIRIVSNEGQNLRVHPDNAMVAATDANLNPGMPAITDAAYSNNYAGATETVLYDIDMEQDKLFKQLPPNDGTLVEVGALGVDASGNGGFDIGGTTGKAYALLGSGSTYALYSLDLNTGAAIRMMDVDTVVHAFAIGLGF